MSKQTEFDIEKWIKEAMEGPGGMRDFDRREHPIYHCSRRIAAASWIVRCLANPKCEGADDMLKAIIAQRGGI